MPRGSSRTARGRANIPSSGYFTRSTLKPLALALPPKELGTKNKRGKKGKIVEEDVPLNPTTKRLDTGVGVSRKPERARASKAARRTSNIVKNIRSAAVQEPQRRSLRLVALNSLDDASAPNYVEGSDSDSDSSPGPEEKMGWEKEKIPIKRILYLPEKGQSAPQAQTEANQGQAHAREQLQEPNIAAHMHPRKKRRFNRRICSEEKKSPAEIVETVSPANPPSAVLSTSRTLSVSKSHDGEVDVEAMDVDMSPANIDEIPDQEQDQKQSPRVSHSDEEEHSMSSRNYDAIEPYTPSQIALMDNLARLEVEKHDPLAWADDCSDLTSLSGRSQHEACDSQCCHNLTDLDSNIAEEDWDRTIDWADAEDEDGSMVPFRPMPTARTSKGGGSEIPAYQDLWDYEQRDLAGTPSPPPLNLEVEDLIEREQGTPIVANGHSEDEQALRPVDLQENQEMLDDQDVEDELDGLHVKDQDISEVVEPDVPEHPGRETPQDQSGCIMDIENGGNDSSEQSRTATQENDLIEHQRSPVLQSSQPSELDLTTSCRAEAVGADSSYPGVNVDEMDVDQQTVVPENDQSIATIAGVRPVTQGSDSPDTKAGIMQNVKARYLHERQQVVLSPLTEIRADVIVDDRSNLHPLKPTQESPKRLERDTVMTLNESGTSAPTEQEQLRTTNRTTAPLPPLKDHQPSMPHAHHDLPQMRSEQQPHTSSAVPLVLPSATITPSQPTCAPIPSYKTSIPIPGLTSIPHAGQPTSTFQPIPGPPPFKTSAKQNPSICLTSPGGSSIPLSTSPRTKNVPTPISAPVLSAEAWTRNTIPGFKYWNPALTAGRRVASVPPVHPARATSSVSLSTHPTISHISHGPRLAASTALDILASVATLEFSKLVAPSPRIESPSGHWNTRMDFDAASTSRFRKDPKGRSEAEAASIELSDDFQPGASEGGNTVQAQSVDMTSSLVVGERGGARGGGTARGRPRGTARGRGGAQRAPSQAENLRAVNSLEGLSSKGSAFRGRGRARGGMRGPRGGRQPPSPLKRSVTFAEQDQVAIVPRHPLEPINGFVLSDVRNEP